MRPGLTVGAHSLLSKKAIAFLTVSSGEADRILADVVDSAVGVVCQHQHLADASEHRRIRNQQRSCRDGHGASAGEAGVRAVAGRGLHDGSSIGKRRTTRMQRLPQQALELGIRFVLRLGRRDRKRHRRQRTHRHRTWRKRRPRRAAAVCRADRNRIVDLPADLQIITCTGLDADKLARKRSCEIVVGGRRRVRAI
mgnify:FL=1